MVVTEKLQRTGPAPLVVRSSRWSWLPQAGPVLSGIAAAALVWLAARTALPDDAYITLDYARNLVEHGHWGLLADRWSNTATSPANVWLLAVAYGVSHRPGVAVGLVLAVALGLVGWWADGLRRELALRSVLPYLVVTLLASSPLLVSTIGLETYLACAALLGVARYAAARRAAPTGLLVAAAVLVRPDLAVPAVVLAVVGLGATRKLGLCAALAVVVALPWHLFAWVVLGGFVPDTAWIKVRDPAGPTMLTAPKEFFALYYPTASALAVVPVVLGLVAAVAAWRHRRDPWARVTLALIGAGWAHWAALVVLHAFPQAWYFGPIIGCSAAGAAVWLVVVAARALAAAVAVASAVALVAVSGPLPWAGGPMQVNLAASDQYVAIGRELGQLTGGQPIRGPGEVGALAWGSASPIVDHLSDPSRARTFIRELHLDGGRTRGLVMRASWAFTPAPTPSPTERWMLTFDSYDHPHGRVVRSWAISLPSRGPDRLVLAQIH